MQNEDPKMVTKHCDAKAKSTDATPDATGTDPTTDVVQNEATRGPQDASPPITDERSKEENVIRSATEVPSSDMHSANSKESISTGVSSGDSHSRTDFPDGGSRGGLIKNGVAEHQEVVNGVFKSQDVNMEDAVVNENGDVRLLIASTISWLTSRTDRPENSLFGDEKGPEGVNDRMEVTSMYISIYHA
jgi:hypothetical protein